MKKYLYYLLFAANFFIGCEKNDGPVPKNIGLERVPQPQIVINGGSQAIDMLNLNGFKGVFNVGLYNTTDAPPVKFDVVVMKNSDKGNVKVFKTDVTTFPTTLDITIAQLTALFGVPVVLGDNYDISVDVYTQSGKKYEAFPATGVGYGSGIASQPGASTFVRYSAICQYNPSIYQGAFEVVKDDFAELVPGDVLTLTKVSDNSFSFLYIHPELTDPLPVIVTVNTGNNVASIAKQKVGTEFYGYVNPNFAASGIVNNFVAPCDQSVTLNITYTVDAGSFGSAVLVLKKKL